MFVFSYALNKQKIITFDNEILYVFIYMFSMNGNENNVKPGTKIVINQKRMTSNRKININKQRYRRKKTIKLR